MGAKPGRGESRPAGAAALPLPPPLLADTGGARQRPLLLPGGGGRPGGRTRRPGRCLTPPAPGSSPQLGPRNDALLREIHAARHRLGLGDPGR